MPYLQRRALQPVIMCAYAEVLIVKKSAILCILLVLVMVLSTVSVSAFAATDPTAGTFKVDGATISKSDDGYYYVNKGFEYIKNSSATGYFYKSVQKSELDKLDANTLYQSATGKDSVPNVDPEGSGDPLYYAFADYYTKDGSTTFSQVVVLVVDTVAPVLDDTALTQWLENPDNEGSLPNDWIKAQEDYKLPLGWVTDISILTEVTAQTERKEEGSDVTNTVNNENMLTITFEYCPTDGHFTEKEWQSGAEIDLTSVNRWWFRYVVTDAAGNEVKSKPFYRYVRDITPPEISLTSTQLKVETSGTKAGQSYTIPTPTYSDAIGVEKSYYIVYKLVNGKYIEIFNSDTKEIVEGYEKFITTDGVLTPASNEVTPTVDGKPQDVLYKVVYHAEDKYGSSSELELKILTTQPVSAVEILDAWKITLIVVAAVCAVAIVVLIFIKPKSKPTNLASR